MDGQFASTAPAGRIGRGSSGDVKLPSIPNNSDDGALSSRRRRTEMVERTDNVGVAVNAKKRSGPLLRGGSDEAKAPPAGEGRRDGRVLARALSHGDIGTEAVKSVDDEHNPFALPQEDVFLMREREKQQKLEEREKQQQLKIWDKTRTQQPTASVQRTRTVNLRTMRGQLAPQQERMFQGRRREKENMADFIAKKRDMFLIQMSLDTKRQEIQKLEEKAQMKEDALKKSEMMLEEDAMRFDAFLKDNDRKAHDALKRADQETKEKQEKAAEIKKLTQEISKVENEMSKYEENLAACKKYKDFLWRLTPEEYKEEVRQKKEERRRKKEAERAKRRAEAKGTDKSEEEHEDDESDEDEMYFKRPEQLLDIFAQLEERNLFLIQNVQETEEALEELKQKFNATRTEMEEKTKVLETNIADLKAKIKAEDEKAHALAQRTEAKNSAGDQVTLLDGLAEKVKEVYFICGFESQNTDPLDMLREIEGWLEYLLTEINNLDKKEVFESEKKKETERRNKVRQQKKLEQKKQYEERLAKSTARAKAEVHRRAGKQVMFRSPPIRKKKVKEDTRDQKDEEAEDIRKYFT